LVATRDQLVVARSVGDDGCKRVRVGLPAEALLEGEETVLGGRAAAEVQKFAAALPRPFGPGVDEQRPGLELSPDVCRPAQVVVGEAFVCEEEGAADDVIVPDRERDPEPLPQTCRESSVVLGREDVELSRPQALHRHVVDLAEALERLVAVAPHELERPAGDCQVPLTSLRHPFEAPGVWIDPTRVDGRRRAVVTDVELALVDLGQLFRAPQEGV